MFALVLLLLSAAAYDTAYVARNEDQATFFENAFKKVINGAPELGIKSADPLYVDYFESGFSILKYRVYNTTIKGLSNCTSTGFKLSRDGYMVQFILNCSNFVSYSAVNDVCGYVASYSMNGRGPAEITYGRFVFRVYAQLRYVLDRGGNIYFELGPYSTDVDAIGPLKYNFMGLYGGNSNKTAQLNKYVNDNWQTVKFFSIQPICDAFMQIIISNLNRVLLFSPAYYYVY